MSIIIDGQNIDEIIANAKALAAAGGSPEAKSAFTNRDGSFAGGPVSIRADVSAGRILLHVSPDNQWHVNIAHDDKDTVNVLSTATSLEITVERQAQTSVFVGRGGGFGSAITVGGGIRGVTIINGVVIGGDTPVLVEIALPAGIFYRADLRTGSGDMLVDASGLALSTLRTKSGSGDVTANVSNAPVEAIGLKTGSGDIELSLAPSVNCTADLSTGSGDVDLSLGRGLTIDLRVHTGSGDKDVRHPDLAKMDKSHWQATGGPVTLQVEVDTGSGDVSVR